MTDIQFYKSFYFNLYSYTSMHHTDWYRGSGSPTHYLARMVSGKAKLSTADCTVELSAGDVFYIPKGEWYRSYWCPDESGEVTFYSFGFDLLPNRETGGYKLQKIECSAEELTLLYAMEENITVSALSIGRLYTFLGAVTNKLEQKEISRSDAAVLRALEFMRNNADYSIGDVAHYCGVSESGLYAKFRNGIGKTPVEVRQKITIDRARELLVTTDMSVEEISESLNFSSSSYFRKVFREHTGKTPSQVRKSSKTI